MKPCKVHGPESKLTINSLAIFLIEAYRHTFAVIFGGGCRFYPSCSHYALEAFREYPFLNAFILTLKRLSRCRPGGGFGPDPLPPPVKGNKG